jgi:hypothetical protein
MDIGSINIQIPQAGNSLSPAGKGDTLIALKSRQSVLADAANAGSSETPQQLNSLTDSNFVKQQIETILTTFPPYFPAGSPQRLDLIKGVKGVQDEIKSSKLPMEVKDNLAGQKLTDAATDNEISTALKGIQQYTEDHSPSPSKSKNNNQSSEIVSITI